jgi:hypothetical protein
MADPVIITLSGEDVEGIAQLHGELTSMGDEVSVDCGFQTRVKGEVTWYDWPLDEYTEVGYVDSGIGSFDPGETYEFRAVVSWDGGGANVAYGEVMELEMAVVVRQSLRIEPLGNFSYLTIPRWVADSFEATFMYYYQTAPDHTTGEYIEFRLFDSDGNSSVRIRIDDEEILTTIIDASGDPIANDIVANTYVDPETWWMVQIACITDFIVAWQGTEMDSVTLAEIFDLPADPIAGLSALSVTNHTASNIWVDEIKIHNPAAGPM